MNKKYKLKKNMKLFSLIFGILFLTSLISAIGVTYPQPQNIELKPGESSYFTLQIQTDDFPLTCVPIVEQTQGLELAFNPKYEVEAGQRYSIKPQVIVPKQTGFGSYKATFCMECSPSGDVVGSKIVPRICNLPVTVNVVSERTRVNMLEDTGTAMIVWIFILAFLAISIAILSAIVFYLVRKKRRL